MCSECRSSPCDARCPNAPEPASFCTCNICGGDISYGEDYWEDPDGETMGCKDCVEDMTARELLDYLGCNLRLAEGDYEEDYEPDWDAIRKDRMMEAYA